MTNNTTIQSLTVWGVRGAIPVPAADFLEYGGNTSCISADCGSELVIFDAGSGLVALGDALAGPGRAERIHILLSHLHMDHIMGLVEFQPVHCDGAEIHLYGEAREGRSLQSWLKRFPGPPYWPLGLTDFRARFVLHEIGPDLCLPLAEGLSVRTLRGMHPNQSLLYRLEDGEKSIVYALDCELDDAFAPVLADFAKDSSLLIWDANFTDADIQKGWGHSTWEQGVAMRRAANARSVLMTHFSRKYTDSFLREQERLALQADPAAHFARERMTIKV